MTSKQFDKLLEEQMERCRSLLCSKAREYATEDRLHNFKVAAALEGVTPERALAEMMAKHTVSIYDMCMSGTYPLELWQEKISDSINYLLLLNALMMDADRIHDGEGGE